MSDPACAPEPACAPATGALIALTARLGRAAALSAAMAATAGAPLPGPLRTSTGPRWRFVWTGAGQWLAECPGPPDAARAELAALAGDLGTVVDQSDAYARFLLQGAAARDRLDRLVPIDLHPSVFGPDAAARAPAEHVPLILIARGPDAVEALAPRSMARDAAALLGAPWGQDGV